MWKTLALKLAAGDGPLKSLEELARQRGLDVRGERLLQMDFGEFVEALERGGDRGGRAR